MKINEKILQNFFKSNNIIAKANTDLVKNNILDSLMMVKLVLFIEKKTKKKFDISKFKMNNFKSIKKIMKFINE